MADRIDLRIGPAAETLAALPVGTSIDMAFIDADKTGYLGYLHQLIPLMHERSVVLVNNVLWDGQIVDETDQSDDTIALRECNAAMLGDTQLRLSEPELRGDDEQARQDRLEELMPSVGLAPWSTLGVGSALSPELEDIAVAVLDHSTPELAVENADRLKRSVAEGVSNSRRNAGLRWNDRIAITDIRVEDTFVIATFVSQNDDHPTSVLSSAFRSDTLFGIVVAQPDN